VKATAVPSALRRAEYVGRSGAPSASAPTTQLSPDATSSTNAPSGRTGVVVNGRFAAYAARAPSALMDGLSAGTIWPDAFSAGRLRVFVTGSRRYRPSSQPGPAAARDPATA